MSILYNIFLSGSKSTYIFLFLFLFFNSGRASAQVPTTVNDSICIFTNSLSPDETFGHLHLQTLRYTKFSDNQINFGVTGSEYRYILLKLSAPVFVNDQRLSIDNTSLDTIGIYRVFPDAKKELLYFGGALVTYKNELYNWHTIPVEVSSIPSFYLIALKASQKNINVRYEILNSNALQLKYQAYDRVVYFYIGVISMILIVITVAFFHFKKAEFAAYIGYIVCFAGWVLSHYGRIFPILYPRLPVINQIIKPITSLGACFFLVIVLRLVFKQSIQQHHWLKRSIKWMNYCLVVLIALMLLLIFSNFPPFLKYCLVALWHIGLIISMFLVVYIPLSCFYTSVTAKIFSVAMFVVAFMAFIQVAATIGLVDGFFINEHGLTMGSVFND